MSYATDTLTSNREWLTTHEIPQTEARIADLEKNLAAARTKLQEHGYAVLALDDALDRLSTTRTYTRTSRIHV